MDLLEIVSQYSDFDQLKKSFDSQKPENNSFNIAQKTILQVYFNYPDLIPKIKGSSEQEIVKKWFNAYEAGVRSKASVRQSNLPKTKPDPIVGSIIATELPKLTKEHESSITFAHRLAMSAENILGHLLEEYLSVELSEFGWHCCWNSLVKAVDFVNENGELLQVKNRSNSENSSSSKIRKGLPIQKWHRVDANTGEYKWNELNQKCGTTKLSEKGFIRFVQKTIKSNPNLLPIENESPWLEFRN